MSSVELASRDFWDDYWAKYRLPCAVDDGFSFDRCLAARLRALTGPTNGARALEIGCAPGKWLTFFSQLGYLPSGIDYSEGGIAATRKNFELLGITAENLWYGDFFSMAPEPRFDLVFSLGFIEHFDDPASVVARHAAWLKPGGQLILGVPNFQGVNRAVQAVLDQGILDKHNLTTMNKPFFEELTSALPLRLEYLDYLGSFEPALPIRPEHPRGAKVFAVRAGLKAARYLRRLRWLDGLNHPSFSSYLLASYRKAPESA